MKRTLSIIAASMLASAAITMPVAAQGKSDSAPGHSGESGSGEMGASSAAPGQIKEETSASNVAPGRSAVEVDPDETAAIGSANFGTVISSIRAGKSDLTGLADDATVNVVSVDDLIQGENRVALENAVDDNMESIDDLRLDLAALELEGLENADVDAAVAAQVDAEGNLTIYTDTDTE